MKIKTFSHRFCLNVAYMCIYRVLWILKAFWTVLSETNNIMRNLQKKIFWGSPWKCYYRFMYIAPSSIHSLLALNLPFKGILRKFEVFWCLEWEWSMHFSKDLWKFIQIHQLVLYYGFKLCDITGTQQQWQKVALLDVELNLRNTLFASTNTKAWARDHCIILTVCWSHHCMNEWV